MKSFIVFIFLPLLSYSLHAQIDVAWGAQQIANPKNSYISAVVGSDNTKIYTLKEKPGGIGRNSRYFLDSYSRKSLSSVGTNEFILPQQNERTGFFEHFFGEHAKYRSAELEKLYLIGGHFILFSSYYSHVRQKYYSFVQSLTENGMMGKAFTCIDTIDTESKRNRGSFGFEISANQHQILAYRNDPYGKNNFEKIRCKVFDEKLNLQWMRNLELPYQDKQFQLSRIRIDSAGNIILLANLAKNKENTERHKPDYNYSIFVYFRSLDQVKEYTIDLGDKYISDITFNINPAGNIICTGFYSKNSESSQAGCFFLKIDMQTTEVTDRSVREFPKDFLLQFMSDRKIEKGRELFNFDIDHLLLRTDGSSLMVAEQYFMDVVSYYNPASRSYNYSYHYYYNDIIVVSFNVKGEITLLKKVGKYQHTVNDGGPYSSYVLADGGDMLHFIYNDHPDNLHRTESEIEHGHISSMNNPGRSVVVMVSMDMKGNTQRTQLLDNHSRKNYTWFMPKLNKSLGEKEVVLFARKGRYYRLGRISL